MVEKGLDAHRFAEHREIARENGEKIIADPPSRWTPSPMGSPPTARQDFEALLIIRPSDDLDDEVEIGGLKCPC